MHDEVLAHVWENPVLLKGHRVLVGDLEARTTDLKEDVYGS